MHGATIKKKNFRNIFLPFTVSFNQFLRLPMYLGLQFKFLPQSSLYIETKPLQKQVLLMNFIFLEHIPTIFRRSTESTLTLCEGN